MKYRVKKKSTLLYPDGSIRGMGGYVVDSRARYERITVAEQADVLERTFRQAQPSPVDLRRLAASASPSVEAADSFPAESPQVVEERQDTEPKATKKKAKKKRVFRKKKAASD